MEPEWKEPPAPRAGLARRGDIDRIVEKLKERPGEWALVARNTSPSVASWKARGCDTKTVTAGLGYKKARCDIYARWPESESRKLTDDQIVSVEQAASKPGSPHKRPGNLNGVVPDYNKLPDPPNEPDDLPWGDPR